MSANGMRPSHVVMDEAAAMYQAGRDHEEAVYPKNPCHWCGATGVDALLGNRQRLVLNDAWRFTQHEGETPFAPDTPTRIVRIACFSYDQRRAQGVVLCPLAEAIEHCNDMVKLGWHSDNELPRPEWCCRRCSGTGALA